MKKIFAIFLFITLFVLNVFSQEKGKPFSLNLSIEHRLPDVYGYQEFTHFFGGKDRNNEADYLFVEFEHNIGKNWFLGFSEGVTYNNTGYFDKLSNTAYKDKNKLLHDIKFLLGWKYVFNDNNSLKASVGIAKMNMGDYFYMIDENGNITKFNFSHIGYNIDVKYVFKDFAGGIGFYHIDNYETSPVKLSKTGILYLSLSYNLVKF